MMEIQSSRMVPEIKERLLTALRSYKYAQGVGFLKRSSYFCCLGVLCDLKDSSIWTVPPKLENSFATASDRASEWGTSREYTFLPLQVQMWSGLDRQGTLNTPIEVQPTMYGQIVRTARSLADLNDFGYSFEQIAQVIEEQF